MRERGDSGALALNEGRPKPCWKWQKSRLHDHTEFKVSDRMEHALNFSRKQRGRRSGQRSERDVGDEGGGETGGCVSRRARGPASRGPACAPAKSTRAFQRPMSLACRALRGAQKLWSWPWADEELLEVSKQEGSAHVIGCLHFKIHQQISRAVP